MGCAGDTWGDDWGAPGIGATPACCADEELDALLNARDARVTASKTGMAHASAGAAPDGKSLAAALAEGSAGADEDGAWTGTVETAPADAWPCLALEIYDEPPAESKTGAHEQELLDRYLKSGLADEDAGAAGMEDSLAGEVLEGLRSEAAKLRAEVGGAAEDMDDTEDDDAADAQAEWLQTFQRRVERSPAQVVRYSWGGLPLWVAPPPKELANGVWPPPCARCGGPRCFEVQLLPTLLSQLRAAAPAREAGPGPPMEWGTIAVYTCEQDCTAEEPCEEFVVVQAAV